MSQRISLNGDDWSFKPFLGEDWVWRNAEKPDTRDLRHWYQGTVPGSVHHDLLRHGLIPDPSFELNSLRAEWAAARTWIYKKRFLADPAWQGSRVLLQFEGVDYEAQFFLNGERLGTHRSMFTPVSFEIGGGLRYGEENLLCVVIEAAPHEQPQVGRTGKVRTHKSRMTYWWDFCPRMVHQGIWDGVWLQITGPARIEDVFVRPRLLPGDDRAEISVAVRASSQASGAGHATVEVLDGDRVVASGEAVIQLTAAEVRLPLEQPRLWWSNGHGEQPLYRARVTLHGPDGAPSDTRTVTFGIRRVEMVPNDTPDATARPYTFVVNGRKVYINGWNWVPIDAMYGVERPEKLKRLLELARRANVNMLRIWGGGLIEKEAFYDLCDQYGIMVWQEFIQSSSGIANTPSRDPEFIGFMVGEAEQIVPRRRNHPSLVLWCGGNELTEGDRPLDNDEPVLGALRDVVARLDPDRFWLPTSPTGRQFSNTLRAIEQDPLGLHDVHGPWEHQGLTAQYTLYNKGTSLLHSEFGVEGMANLPVLERTIAPENRWPATRDNPVYFHRGAWWINEPMIQQCFGSQITQVEVLQRASQFLQAEGLRYGLESNRRRQWQSSGSLPWQFNEPYPNAYCTSAVDYYAWPKAVYYAVAQAYAPVSITASFPTQAWAGRDQFEAQIWVSNGPAEVAAKVRLIDFSGRLLREHVFANRAGAGAPTFACPMAEIQTDLFYLDLALADGSAANRYLLTRTETLAPMLHAPATWLRASLAPESPDTAALTIANMGPHTALQVRLDLDRDPTLPGWAYFSHNHFCLLPGESRRIRVQWSGVPATERRLLVKGWNTEVIDLA